MAKKLLYSILLLGFCVLQAQDDVRVRFNGFGDITFGHNFGGPAEKGTDTLFKAYGEDPYPKGTNQGVGLQGLDLVNTLPFKAKSTCRYHAVAQVDPNSM